MIARLRELLKAGTPGPWAYVFDGDGYALTDSPDVPRGRMTPDPSRVVQIGETHDEPDAALIAAAINALPALLDVVEAANEAHNCVDHVDNCCRDWCDPCRCGAESQDRLRRALDAMRGTK